MLDTLNRAVSNVKSQSELCDVLSESFLELLELAAKSASSDGRIRSLLSELSANLEARSSQLRLTARFAREALLDSEARFRSLVNLGSDWYWEQNEQLRFTRFDGRIPEQNADAFKTYLGKCVWEVGHESETDWEDQRRLQEKRLPFRDFVHSKQLRDGTRRYFSASGDPVFNANGGFVGYRGVGRDITHEKLARDRFEHQATHDTLTGLPNRAMIGPLFAQALHSARRYERRLAVLFVDLDGFKAVNDGLGHEAGDEVLRVVAARFRDALRVSDVIARWGGDEFVVLAQEVGDREDAVGVARKLLAAATAPLEVATRKCVISASIGIALFPEQGDSAEVLLKRADTAMYEAKHSGKNALRFHS